MRRTFPWIVLAWAGWLAGPTAAQDGLRLELPRDAQTPAELESAVESLNAAEAALAAGDRAEAGGHVRASFEALIGLPNSDTVIVILYELYGHAWELGDLTTAREAITRVWSQFEKTLPADHPDLQTARLGLGLVLREIGELNGARDLFEKVASLREVTLPDSDEQLQQARQHLAITLHALGKLTAARELFERNLAAKEAALAPDDPDLAEARQNLAVTLKGLGELAAARELEEQVLGVRLATLPRTHPDLQDSRHNLAATLWEMGELSLARDQLRRALVVREATLAAGDPVLQRTRVDMATLMKAMHDLAPARVLEERVLKAAKATLPDDHDDLQEARSNLARTLYELGDYQRALPLQQKVLGVRLLTRPEDHEDQLAARHDLGRTLYAMGDVRAALPMQERVLAARTRTLRPDHDDVASAREALFLTLSELRHAPAAQALGTRVLEDQLHHLPPGHIDVQRTRLGLARALGAMGSLEHARTMLEETLATAETPPTGEGADPASLVQLQELRLELARLLSELEDHHGARALLQSALGELRRQLPEEHPLVLRTRASLAEAVHRMGDAHGARTLYERNLAIQQNVLPTMHPDLATTQERLAHLMQETGDVFGSLSMHEGVLAVQETRLPDGHPDLQHYRQDFAWILAEVGEREHLARLAHQMTEGLRQRLEAGTTVARRDAASIARGMRDDVSSLLSLAGIAGANPRAIFELVETLRAAEFGHDLAQPIDLGALVEALPERAAAISLRRYTRTSNQRVTPLRRSMNESLLAHVIREDGTLTRIELGPVAPIEEAVRQWRGTLASRRPGAAPLAAADEPLARASIASLRHLVLDPLIDAAGDVDELYVSLDDVLTLVPLAGLPLDDGVVGDRFRVHTVTSLVALLDRWVPLPRGGTLAAMGGIDYLNKASSSAALQTPLVMAPPVGDTLAVDDSVPLAPLTGWRQHIEMLTGVFKDATELSPVLHTHRGATKAALFDLAPSLRYLYIGTHLLVAAATVPSRDDAARLRRGSRGLPLDTLCGLALAGADRGMNAFGRVPGMATAEELAMLQLRRCELVVIGGGDPPAADRRTAQAFSHVRSALHRAGAEATLMSLWEADDRWTRELLLGISTRLWRDGASISEALWEAQQELRQAGASTSDWAGWLLVTRRAAP